MHVVFINVLLKTPDSFILKIDNLCWYEVKQNGKNNKLVRRPDTRL